MTYSNGNYNPNPLANPFNTRLGPANYSLNFASQSYSGSKFNSSKKDLPNPVMLGQNTNGLHTPDAVERPMTLADIQSIADSYGANKTWNDKDIYTLSPNSLDNSLNSFQIKQEVEQLKNRINLAINSLSKEDKDLLSSFEQIHHSNMWIDESKVKG